MGWWLREIIYLTILCIHWKDMFTNEINEVSLEFFIGEHVFSMNTQNGLSGLCKEPFSRKCRPLEGSDQWPEDNGYSGTKAIYTG